MINETERDKDRLLVAEYVLKLLDLKKEEDLEKRLSKEPQLQSEYIFWSEQFCTLTKALPQASPSAQLKVAINKRLFGEPAVIEKTAWWALFSAKKVSSMVMAIVLTFGLFYLLPKPFTADYSAVLQTQDESILMTAEYDTRQHLLRLISTKGKPVANRDIELWLISGDQLPVSLGVLVMTPTHEILLPKELFNNIIGATLALSDEPIGGSPTGQPTGAVLATATVQAI